MLDASVNLGQLQTRIGVRLQDTSFRSIPGGLATVTDIINQSLKYYKFRRFWFNEELEIITLAQGTQVIPSSGIPDDFLCETPEGALSIFYGNIFYPLEKRSSEVFDSENVQAIGLPYIFTYRTQQYEVYFLPNIAYTLYFRYLHDYAPLVALTDSNDFTNFADMMIQYNALSRIYGEIKQDRKMEAYYTSRANDEEENVSRRTTAQAGTGTLVLNSNLIA